VNDFTKQGIENWPPGHRRNIVFESSAEVISGLFDAAVQEPFKNIRGLFAKHAPHPATEDVAMHALRHPGPMPTEEDLISAIALGILVRLEDDDLMS
jgi:hypothetical protein